MLKNIIKLFILLFITFAILFGVFCLEALTVMLLVNIGIALLGGTVGLTFTQSLFLCAMLGIIFAYFDKD